MHLARISYHFSQAPSKSFQKPQARRRLRAADLHPAVTAAVLQQPSERVGLIDVDARLAIRATGLCPLT
eukprot:10562311-Lingulodinium_polyedra.AAC.1